MCCQLEVRCTTISEARAQCCSSSRLFSPVCPVIKRAKQGEKKTRTYTSARGLCSRNCFRENTVASARARVCTAYHIFSTPVCTFRYTSVVRRRASQPGSHRRSVLSFFLLHNLLALISIPREVVGRPFFPSTLESIFVHSRDNRSPLHCFGISWWWCGETRSLPS